MIKIEKVCIDDIVLNEKNPRNITKKGLSKMQKSIKDFPEMLQIREIVVDENYTLLGGKCRLLALQKNGETHATVKVVSGLTEKQKEEFLIKDNSHFGSWDYDMLYNTFDEPLLMDAGLEIKEVDGTLLQYLRETKDDDDKTVNQIESFNNDNIFVAVYLNDVNKNKLDSIMKKKKFNDYSETVSWLINEIQ